MASLVSAIACAISCSTVSRSCSSLPSRAWVRLIQITWCRKRQAPRRFLASPNVSVQPVSPCSSINSLAIPATPFSLSALPDPLAPAARCPAPAKGRRHVPNNMGQCPISIQVFFPDAPRSCEGMDSPCVQAEAGVRMPLTRRPGPRSVPARCRRRATRGQRLQRFCAAVGAGPARAPRPRPRGRPPERARRTPVPSHTARRRWSSELRP